MKLSERSARFDLGKTVITATANETLNMLDVVASLGRHASGDWGEVCPEDAAANDYALLTASAFSPSIATKTQQRFGSSRKLIGPPQPFCSLLIIEKFFSMLSERAIRSALLCEREGRDGQGVHVRIVASNSSSASCRNMKPNFQRSRFHLHLRFKSIGSNCTTNR